MKQGKRCLFLDYAKALAIMLMVLLHTTPRYEALSNIVGAFHMAVFFLISGIFFNGHTSKFKTMLKKSVTQLLVPYLGFSFIALSICWISPYIHPEIYPGLNSFGKIFKAAIIGIFVGQDYYTGYSFMPLGPLWFLLSLFWCRMILYLWLRPSHFKLFIRSIIIIGLFTIYLYQPLILSLNGMTVSFPFFVLGYYSKNIFLKLNNVSTQLRIVLIIVCISLLSVFTDSQVIFGAGRISGFVPLAYLRGLAGCIALLTLCTFFDNAKKLSVGLSVLGASTLTVLGLHFHFILPSKVIYSYTFGDPGNIHIVYAIIVVIISVICLTYINKFLSNKMPYIIGKQSNK